jgi:hypothetical protein
MAPTRFVDEPSCFVARRTRFPPREIARHKGGAIVMFEANERPLPESTQATPVLSPDEIRDREARAAETLPAKDSESVDRSAGEGMVGTPVEAATIPTSHVTGHGDLMTSQGTVVAGGTVDLQVVPPAWSGTITLADDADALETPARYMLRLQDGRGGPVTITARAGCTYTIEGSGEFEA